MFEKSTVRISGFLVYSSCDNMDDKNFFFRKLQNIIININVFSTAKTQFNT